MMIDQKSLNLMLLGAIQAAEPDSVRLALKLGADCNFKVNVNPLLLLDDVQEKDAEGMLPGALDVYFNMISYGCSEEKSQQAIEVFSEMIDAGLDLNQAHYKKEIIDQWVGLALMDKVGVIKPLTDAMLKAGFDFKTSNADLDVLSELCSRSSPGSKGGVIAFYDLFLTQEDILKRISLDSPVYFMSAWQSKPNPIAHHIQFMIDRDIKDDKLSGWIGKYVTLLMASAIINERSDNPVLSALIKDRRFDPLSKDIFNEVFFRQCQAEAIAIVAALNKQYFVKSRPKATI